MALIVQKYGGTSVASPERVKHVARRIARWKARGHQLVVVVSAMAGETNRLLALAREVQGQPNPRELDVMVATGEQVTIALMSMALMELGVKARSYTGAQVKILTDSAFTRARIRSIDEPRIRADLGDDHVVVVAGFQGVDEAGNITTLGRGGSDTTAVALAAALKTVTFEEMLEMASLGSRVLQIRSVEFAGKYKVRLRVLSSFEEESEGTLITFEEDENMEQAIISGIAFNRDEAKITILGVPDRPGIAYQILGPIGDAGIDVDMIVQNVGHDELTDFSFTVHRSDYQKALGILDPVVAHIKARDVLGGDRIAKVSVVGVGMRSHAGIASTAFRALAEEGINIQMISTSEIKISVVIDEKYTELAVRVLHKTFGLDQPA
jgi:aspartate kinase